MKLKPKFLLNSIKIILVLATINVAYLAWRYLALRQGWVQPGTAICSISDFVDCDKVLLTAEARAFYVPNALLGFGFFFGSLIWIFLGFKLNEAYHHHIIRTFFFWLVIAAFFTFRFFYLLVQLPAFCPLCPVSHFLTYILLVSSYLLWKRTPQIQEKKSFKPLILLVVLCVGQFWLWLCLWFVLSGL